MGFWKKARNVGIGALFVAAGAYIVKSCKDQHDKAEAKQEFLKDTKKDNQQFNDEMQNDLKQLKRADSTSAPKP